MFCVEASVASGFHGGLGKAHGKMRQARHGAGRVLGLGGAGAANIKAHTRAILCHWLVERGGRMDEHTGRAAHARGQCDAPRRDQIKTARGRTEIGDDASSRACAQTFFGRPKHMLRIHRAQIEQAREIDPMRGKTQRIGRAIFTGGKFIADENELARCVGGKPLGERQRKSRRRRAIAHAGGGDFIKCAGKKPAQGLVEGAGPVFCAKPAGAGRESRGCETCPSPSACPRLFKPRNGFAEKADPVRTAV